MNLPSQGSNLNDNAVRAVRNCIIDKEIPSLRLLTQPLALCEIVNQCSVTSGKESSTVLTGASHQNIASATERASRGRINEHLSSFM